MPLAKTCKFLPGFPWGRARCAAPLHSPPQGCCPSPRSSVHLPPASEGWPLAPAGSREPHFHCHVAAQRQKLVRCRLWRGSRWLSGSVIPFFLQQVSAKYLLRVKHPQAHGYLGAKQADPCLYRAPMTTGERADAVPLKTQQETQEITSRVCRGVCGCSILIG